MLSSISFHLQYGSETQGCSTTVLFRKVWAAARHASQLRDLLARRQLQFCGSLCRALSFSLTSQPFSRSSTGWRLVPGWPQWQLTPRRAVLRRGSFSSFPGPLAPPTFPENSYRGSVALWGVPEVEKQALGF